MSIQAVIFDMGGTIETFHYDRELRLKAVPGMMKQLSAAGIELSLSDEEFLDTFTSRYQLYHSWRKETHQELPTWQIWTEFILPDYPEYKKQVTGIAEDLSLYYETHFYHREMRPEMPAVLEAIQRMGFKIGVISNVVSQGMVPANLKDYGIRQYFDPVVMSSGYGWRKPDPSIFHYAARLIGEPTSRCCYVGDRIARDIIGARRAGYGMAVQIQHHFEHGEDDNGAVPDAIIQQMSELVDLLEANNKRIFPGPTGVKKAVFFDAGDVLYYRPDRGRLLNEFLQKLGLSANGITPPERKSLVDRVFQGQISQDEYREELLRKYGVKSAEDIQACKRLMTQDEDRVEFFTGVCETLRILKERGYLLGIITDTSNSAASKFRWFEKGGIGNVWDSYISSNEIGVRKPDIKIFTAGLNQLGICACEAVFVGHKAAELDGARAAGITTVAFNSDPDAYSEITVEKFSDLLSLPQLSTGKQAEKA